MQCNVILNKEGNYMNYTAQLSGKIPEKLSNITITQSDALAGDNDVEKLNIVFISEADVVGSTQKISTMNVKDVIPVLYTPSNLDPYYYNTNDIASVYSNKPKIHEAHIPYLHGQLINHGLLPFNVYNTLDQQLELDNQQISDNDTNVVSSNNAASLINNVARVLVNSTDNNLILLGYQVATSGTVHVTTLSSYSFSGGESTPVEDWRLGVTALSV